MEEEVKKLTDRIKSLDVTNPANMSIAVSLLNEARVLLDRIRAIKVKCND